MTNATFDKVPGATKDYSRRWTNWLAVIEDTIESSEWTITPDDGELTIDDESVDGTITTVWLSGGVIDKSYTVTNRVHTAGGRTELKSIHVNIVATQEA
jgi:hypothetical protein